MPKRKKPSVDECEILQKLREIAFSEDSKDSDKLRALDKLEEYLRNTDKNEETYRKLDRVLEMIGDEE